MRIVALVLAILYPGISHAAPVTFTFSAGDVSGWYTVETTAPGVRQRYDGDVYWNREGGMFYPAAIIGWGVSVGDFWSATGSDGSLSLAVDRGEFSETSYTAYMWSGPDVALSLRAWTPTHDRIIVAESLDAVPDLSGNDTISEAILFDEKRINVSRRYEQLDTLSARTETVSQSSITPVPEPSTMALLGLGLIAAFSKGRRSRTCEPSAGMSLSRLRRPCTQSQCR